MDDLIRRSDVFEAVGEAYERLDNWDAFATAIKSIPASARQQGEWVDEAISIIDDMQKEGIVDYEQAREFRMRARMKGASRGKT